MTEPIKNAELMMVQQEAKQRFNKVLLGIQKLPEIKVDPRALAICRNFRYHLKPTTLSDTANLPYYSQKPEAQEPNKILCILSLISYTIPLLWKLLKGNERQALAIRRNLAKLEGYIENGLDVYEIVGEKFNPGFYLEKKNDKETGTTKN